MPARYCICPIVDGTVVPPNEPPNSDFGTRPAIVDVPDTPTRSATIPTDNNGDALHNFAFCHFIQDDLSLIEEVTNTYVFPDFPLDAEMGSMDAATRTAFQQSVEAFDIDGNGLHFDASHAATDSYGSLIERFGLLIQPNFKLSEFFAKDNR